MDMTVKKKGEQRGKKAEEAQNTATSRSRRPAKHVRNGLDLTAELYYQPQEEQQQHEHDDSESKEEKEVETRQQRRVWQRRAEAGKDGGKPVAAADEQPAAETDGLVDVAGADNTQGAVVLDTLRGRVLLISTKDIQVHEETAKGLGARVSHPSHILSAH